MSPTLLCSLKSISWKRQKLAVKWTLLPPTQLPYRTDCCFRAVSSADLRKVMGWVLTLLVSRLWIKIFVSSWVKSFSRRYSPCSRTTTWKPLVESSFASTPPAAPEPTITKSTSSDGLYVTMGRLIFSPFRRRRVASRDSPCRRSRTARKSYEMDRGQWLSSQQSRGSRRPPGRREIRKSYGCAGSERNPERRRGRDGGPRFPAARTPARCPRRFSGSVLRFRRKSAGRWGNVRREVSARRPGRFDRWATLRWRRVSRDARGY